jgi:CDP-diacylglycerol--glycerol-3-phosphate 3-phosphatidyltransferase
MQRPGLWLMWVVIFFALASAVSYFRKFWHKVDARVKKRRRRELLLLERKRQQELAAQRGSRGATELRAATIWKPPEVS